MNFKKQKDFIDAYLQRLNVRPARDGKQFVNVLCNKYDKSFVEKFIQIMTQRPEMTLLENYKDDIYDLKNSSFEFSLDLMRYNADLYFKYFKWFSTIKNIKPKRILDIGCENGFITCFYALLFPKAKIIGIDPCSNAIECAKEMAKRLKIKNVSFKKIGLSEALSLFPPNNFDLITSVMTFKEVIGSYIQRATGTPEEYRYWSLYDLDLSIGKEEAKTSLDIVYALLTENGRFISFERWFPEDTIWWVDKLKASGLYIDWEQTENLGFHEVGESRLFPAFITDKIVKEYGCIEKTSELWLKNHTNEKQELLNLPAEIVFNNYQEKSFFKGVQCNYSDDLLKVRYEFWISNDKLLCYQYGNTGYRELRILPMQSYDSINQMITDLRQHLSQYQYEVYIYDSITEREKLA